MRIAIFGANGQTGRLATRRALDAGHTTVAVTRRPDDFPFTDPALSVAGADVHDTDAVADIVADADAVLSALGVPFTREPVNTYSRGTANVVAAMQSSGVTRLVVVSSTGAYPAPGRTGAPFALRLVEPVITKTIGKTVYDDIRLMESVDTTRDLLAGVLETYLSQTSNRMNRVMKQLSIVATVALPLIVIAGIYGMNFSRMPLIHDPLGFWVAVASMALG